MSTTTSQSKTATYLATEETAALLRITPHTLAVWRCTRKTGLPYSKIDAQRCAGTGVVS